MFIFSQNSYLAQIEIVIKYSFIGFFPSELLTTSLFEDFANFPTRRAEVQKFSRSIMRSRKSNQKLRESSNKPSKICPNIIL